MKFVTLMLLVIVAAQGCATAPADVPPASGAQQVTWTRGLDRTAFVDERGVCHTFSRDAQDGMRALGSQVQACFEGSLPVAAALQTSARRVKIAFQKTSAARIDDLFAEHAAQSMLQAAGRRKAAVFAVRGFYAYRGDTCHVVVSDHADYLTTLGHEFKHCLDGEYHDERGVWRRASAG